MELRPLAEGPQKGALREVARAYLALAEGKIKQVPARERELGRTLLRLDPKLLVAKKPKKPAKPKPKAKKSDDGWDDGWSDSEWDDEKSKQPKSEPKQR